MVNIAPALLLALAVASATSHSLTLASPNSTSLAVPDSSPLALATGSLLALPTNSPLVLPHRSPLAIPGGSPLVIPTGSASALSAASGVARPSVSPLAPSNDSASAFATTAGCKTPWWSEIQSLKVTSDQSRRRSLSPKIIEVTRPRVHAGLVGNNDCHTEIVRVDGAVVGPTGTVSFKVKTGFSSIASYILTKPSSTAVGFVASVSFDIAGKFQGSATITNTVGSRFSVTHTDERENTLVLEAPPGRYCEVLVPTRTCQKPSTAAVPYTASGSVKIYEPAPRDRWVYISFDNYGDAGSGTSPAQFDGSLVSVTKGGYNVECR
ncbi:hypothetical protein C8R44DRAFT_862111 [Mycena epipterygia]|nr:hypothetical protein C8R44DRAFT_862111 [Mycena epipterygia]